MKTHIYHLLSGLLLLLFVSCSHQHSFKKSMGPLELSVTHSRNREQVKFQYRQDESKLAGLKSLEGTLYYFAAAQSPYTSDINMTDSDGAWHGSFTLPDSVKAYALKFSSGDQIDNNEGAGYIFPVWDQSGKPVPGALTAESYFYSRRGQFYLGLKSRPDSVIALVQRDHAIHPEMKKTWPQAYFSSLIMERSISALRSLDHMKRHSSISIKSINIDSFIQTKLVPTYNEIQAGIKQMLSRSNASERDYMTAYFMYLQMRMKSKADSLGKLMMQKFPTGTYAQQKEFASFSTQNNLDSLVVMYKRFRKKFHTSDLGTNVANLKSNMLVLLSMTCVKADKLDEFSHYASQISNKQMRAMVYNQAAFKLGMKGKNLSFDSTAAQRALHLMKEMLDNPDQGKPVYFSKREWLKQIRGEFGNYSDTYAMVMAKKGDLKAAVAAQKIAVTYTDSNRPGINERYAEYLVKSGDIKMAMATIPKFIAKGKFTTKLTDYLKTAYIRQKGSDEGFHAYVDSLASIAGNSLKIKLQREMIDKPAPAFDLTDLNGEKVSLASLKGKIVVVDFWATWCHPCKASFPGMAKVVNAFKNDPNVVFLFVDTWERTKPSVRIKEVSGFITKHKYPFRVLLDQPVPNDMKQYQIANKYRVTGIPTKFVIDPSGHIRFRSVGYYGSTDALVRKVNMMISMVKKADVRV